MIFSDGVRGTGIILFTPRAKFLAERSCSFVDVLLFLIPIETPELDLEEEG
jgi:hypothetical protein